MQQVTRAKLLRLHFCEHDQFEGRPLYEAVVAKCRELEMAGATVYRGLEGYGETSGIHRAHLLGHESPIVVTVVDSAEKIARLVPAVEAMLEKGMIAISEVEALRIENSHE